MAIYNCLLDFLFYQTCNDIDAIISEISQKKMSSKFYGIFKYLISDLVTFWATSQITETAD